MSEKSRCIKAKIHYVESPQQLRNKLAVSQSAGKRV